MKFKDADDAVKIFKEAATIHGECTMNGNYKLGNKNYYLIEKAVNYLIKEKVIDHLLQFLGDSDSSVCGWAAAYLLPIHEKAALKALNSIAQGKGL